ncbi:MAG TPA: glutathione S-transferase family protein [Stellaceae bacterium]|nr:glutathione S-transferase family protein [Stellaceae bacterium]
MSLRLYDLAAADEARRFSPFCWRTRLALAHKGLTVETIPWRFTEKEVLRPSGSEKVPVLVDGTRWIAESSVIAHYLEETYPDRPSLFGGRVGEALTRFYGQWTDTVLHPGILRMIALDIQKHLHEKDRAYFRESREKRFGMTFEALVADRDQKLPAFRQSLTPLRMTLAAQKFLGGEEPLYADYTVFGAFQWARAISDFKLLASDDPIHAWRERMLGLFNGLAAHAVGYPVL